MRVVVSGASGLIGSALVPALREDGHTVRRLVRRRPEADDEVYWDPAVHELDDSSIADADAVVNLNGLGIGDKRWTPDYQRAVVASRVDSTTTLAETIARHSAGVKVFVSGSAVGWYGDRGEDVLTESEPNGDGFLADVVRQWEAATAAAEAAGVRVVRIRSGIVLSSGGGALAKMLLPFRLGIGGRLGSGRQYMSWIAMADEVAAIKHALSHESLSGPVNLTAPYPVTNRELTKALGRALHRPAVAAVPPLALRLGLGDFADEGLLASQRAVPKALLDSGFTFSAPDLPTALSQVL